VRTFGRSPPPVITALLLAGDEKALAGRLGLDHGTVGAWERDEVSRPSPRIRRVFERWLASRVP